MSHVEHLVGSVGGVIGAALLVVGIMKSWNVSFVIPGLTLMIGSAVFLICVQQLDKRKMSKIHNWKSHVPYSCFHSEHIASFEEKLDESRTDSIGLVDIKIVADIDVNDNATSPGTTNSSYGYQLIKSPDINTVVLKKLRDTEKENKNGTGAYLNPGFEDSHL